jgi:hypothetical protein
MRQPVAQLVQEGLKHVACLGHLQVGGQNTNPDSSGHTNSDRNFVVMKLLRHEHECTL